MWGGVGVVVSLSPMMCYITTRDERGEPEEDFDLDPVYLPVHFRPNRTSACVHLVCPV